MVLSKGLVKRSCQKVTSRHRPNDLEPIFAVLSRIGRIGPIRPILSTLSPLLPSILKISLFSGFLWFSTLLLFSAPLGAQSLSIYPLPLHYILHSLALLFCSYLFFSFPVCFQGVSESHIFHKVLKRAKKRDTCHGACH